MDLRRMVPWSLLGLLIAGSLGAAAVSLDGSPANHVGTDATSGRGHPPTPAAPIRAYSPLGFACVMQLGSFREIAASFVVPAVRSQHVGWASTWIGAAAGTSFIQVGATEAVVRRDRSGGIRDVRRFEVFWSDTERSFEETDLAVTHPGDTVHVVMRKSSGGWVLEVRDLTTCWRDQMASGFGRGIAYDVAEWCQEDPISAEQPLRNLPYPDLGPTTFTGLEVDGRRARPSVGNDSAMDAPPGPYDVPGPVRDGVVTIAPATGIERTYLDDTAPFNQANIAFGVAARSHPAVDAALRSSGRSLLDGIDHWRAALGAQLVNWPRRSRPLLRSLLQASQPLSIDLGSLLAASDPASWVNRVLADEDVVHAAASALRGAIGLPLPS